MGLSNWNNFSSIPWKSAAEYQLACYCLQRIGPSSKAGSALIFCRNSRQSIMDNWQLAGQILTWLLTATQSHRTWPLHWLAIPGLFVTAKIILTQKSSETAYAGDCESVSRTYLAWLSQSQATCTSLLLIKKQLKSVFKSTTAFTS